MDCTMSEYLKHWGYTPEKPLERAYEQNPEQVKAWLAIGYASIKQRSKRLEQAYQWKEEFRIIYDQ
jgi:hypothetical protein